MIGIKQMDATLIEKCAYLYQSAYKNEPWNEEYSIDEISAYLSRFLNSDTKRAYMLVLDDKTIGIALGLIAPCIGSDYFRLEDICLSPEYQGNGYGSQFIHLISNCVLNENCDSILLGTQRGYPAHNFYLKNGFKEIDTVLLCRNLGA